MEAAALETLRGWLSTGFLAAITILVARFGQPAVNFLIEMRRLKLVEQEQRAKLRHAEEESDRAAVRDVVMQLRDQLTIISSENKELHLAVRELRGENELLRKEVRELHGIIDGMQRQELSRARAGQMEALENEPVSPPMRHALRVLRDIKKDGEEQ